MLFTDPFGLDTSNANVPVHQGDVILFDKGVTATQSADEATVIGKRTDNSASLTLIFPGSFSPILRPGPTPITLPRILPLAIPIACNAALWFELNEKPNNLNLEAQLKNAPEEFISYN